MGDHSEPPSTHAITARRLVSGSTMRVIPRALTSSMDLKRE